MIKKAIRTILLPPAENVMKPLNCAYDISGVCFFHFKCVI